MRVWILMCVCMCPNISTHQEEEDERLTMQTMGGGEGGGRRGFGRRGLGGLDSRRFI
jgi:hypothetical protein